MDLDPVIRGERVLGRYYEASDGVGGLGCWVHSHPDGREFVVTPFSWGRSPSPGKQGLIDETFEAISDSRQELGSLGHLDTALYVLLHDVPRPDVGEARWIVDEQCWIDVGPQAGYGAYGTDRPRFKSVMAHEIGHCFLMENLEGYSPDTYTSMSRWWDESGAEFLMAFVYPTVDGVIDTVQWEGYREGVDDVRYVTTLDAAIRRATATRHGAKAEAAAAATSFLEDLDVETDEPDAARAEMIRHLLALHEDG